MRFIAALREAEEPFAVICKRFESSRKTGYKWLARYEEGGPAALVDGEPIPVLGGLHYDYRRAA